MITLIKIVGESLNLETGKETPKALVLTNGMREVQLYVDDDQLREVVGLLADVTTSSVEVRTAPVTPIRRPVVVSEAPLEPELVDEPEEPDPGEEFADAATGVDSL